MIAFRKFTLNHGRGVVLLIKVQNYNCISLITSWRKLTQIFKSFEHMLIGICSTYADKCEIIRSGIYFIIVLHEIDRTKISNLAHAIYYHSQTVTFGRDSIFLKCSIASILYPEFSNNLFVLVKQLATHLDSNIIGYYSEFKHVNLKKCVKQEFKALALFKKAYIKEELIFAYQPIVNSKTGQILCYECLLRVPDYTSRLVSASPFILLAEKSGFVNIIDQAVLLLAVNELRKYRELRLAINISNLGVLDPHLIDLADRLLSNFEVANRLIVEITETSLNNDFIKTRQFIMNMHNKGCKIAIDDFGTGFTSFRQLQELPIDIIKIDGCFIKSIISNQCNKFLVETLVKMSEELGIETVAEFVENKRIAQFLMDINVNYMQGNFFSSPVNYRPWEK